MKTKEKCYEEASFQSLAESSTETREHVIHRAMDIYAAQFSLSPELLEYMEKYFLSEIKARKEWYSFKSKKHSDHEKSVYIVNELKQFLTEIQTKRREVIWKKT